MTDLDLRRLDHLTRQPDTVADAIDRYVRIDAVRNWLGDLRDAVRDGYLEPLADDTEAMTGAAFRAPVKGYGLVYRTDPEPKPRVSDVEAFARWYVGEILDDDPDFEGRTVGWGGEGDADVMRRTTVEVADVDAVLDALDGLASGRMTKADTLDLLDKGLHVDVEWHVAGDLLDRLMEGDQPRALVVELDDGWVVLDTATGTPIPGTSVTPPGDPTITVRPDKEVRRKAAAELEGILGKPALND